MNLNWLMADIGTVIWKEWRELIGLWGSRRSGLLNLLLTIGIFGVFLPLQAGQSWVESPMNLIFWVWIPLFLVIAVIADAVAGERERHTLETLLASRLSDRAILLGKIAAAVTYGWSLTLISLLVGLVVVNLTAAQGTLLLYSPAVTVGIVGVSLLGAALAAGVGVLISLRAHTVRQAQQIMGITIILLLFGALYGGQALLGALPPAVQETLANAVGQASSATWIGLTLLLLGAVDTLVVLLALARFRRARLILD